MSATLQLYTKSRQQLDTHGRSEIRLKFYDHPDYIDRLPAARHGDKVKVWCIKCFEKRVEEELARDETSGRPWRSMEELERSLWDLPHTTPRQLRWMARRRQVARAAAMRQYKRT
ncbi:hypothetical protein C8Q77DRAFT_1108442 [Trametes polyzona]|nr:hypothetical protein C8Q77DRAFT_1108442 [Trametes polyzona]